MKNKQDVFVNRIKRILRPFGIFSFALPFVMVSPIAASAEKTRIDVRHSITSSKHHTLTFEQSPRLFQAVTHGASLIRADSLAKQAHMTDVIFWQAAGLFSQSENRELHLLHRDVIDNLLALQDDNFAEPWKSSFQSLLKFIQQSSFQTRVSLDIDPDLLLSGKAQNPLLSGDLTLLLPERQHDVQLLGAIKSPVQLRFDAGKTLKDYLAQAQLINSFGTSEVTIISPNGKIQQAPIAYWNWNPIRPVPGSVIYVPYASITSKFSSLNARVSELLTHRVL